jgi:VanZ family protein
MLVLSFADEAMQSLMGLGRTGDMLDVVADNVGIIVGLLSAPPIVNAMLRYWKKNH